MYFNLNRLQPSALSNTGCCGQGQAAAAPNCFISTEFSPWHCRKKLSPSWIKKDPKVAPTVKQDTEFLLPGACALQRTCGIPTLEQHSTSEPNREDTPFIIIVFIIWGSRQTNNCRAPNIVSNKAKTTHGNAEWLLQSAFTTWGCSVPGLADEIPV